MAGSGGRLGRAGRANRSFDKLRINSVQPDARESETNDGSPRADSKNIIRA